ncbi:MAG: leucine-rich repeat domain-containing protein, partial [Lachnospiraceae bacterium]
MKKWFKEFQEHPFTMVQIGKEKQKSTYLAMWSRMIALALVCCMVVTLLPTTALAAEEKPAVESGEEAEKEEPAKEEPAKEKPVKEEPVKEEPVKEVSDPQVTSRAVTETSWDIGKNTPSDITATLSTDKTTLTISGTGEMENWRNVWDVPWAQAVSTINKVTIAEGVTTIGKNAFVGCGNMSICTLPTTLTTMGDFIFKDCKTLTSITIPEGVTSMGRAIFTNCVALTEVTIPESVKVIWWEVFNGCSNLATVTLNIGSEEGKNKKFIQANAFQGINENLTIKVNAKNDANTFQEWSSTLQESGKGTVATFTDATKATTALTNVPSACTITATYGEPPTETTWDIGKTNAADIKAVLSADQTTLTIRGKGEMKDWAQKSQVPWQKAMNNITTVTIAEGVTNIGNHAFFQCWKLNTITLPTTLTSIGNYAFYSCVELNSIPIPEAVTTIGHSAFNNCVKLSSIPIPEGVTTIGNSAFIGCKALTSITIPEKVTAIEWSTFYGCDNLTSIIIPEAVTAIGQEAFYGCSKLATVTMNFSNDKNSKKIDGSVFQGIKDKATINVNAKNDTKSFKAWSSTLSGTLPNVGAPTAATFTDAAAATTTLTNVPDNCMITAEYAHDSVTDGMIQTIGDQQYTGSAIEPVLTVQAGNKKLALDTDYTVTYGNNINAGTATATIAGAGKYTGTASKTFQINKAEGTKVKGYAVPGTLKAITNITPMLSNIALDGKGHGTWSWAADQKLTADNTKKEQTFQAVFTPTDGVNYKTVKTGVKVAVSTITIAHSKVYNLTKGETKKVEQLVTTVGADLKEGTDYQMKLTVSQNNMISVSGNEITAKDVGTVKVIVDVMAGQEKAASDYIIVEVQSNQIEQSRNTAEEIKDLLNEVNKEGTPSKDIVNAIADSTIRMDRKEKEKLSHETLKTLDQLFQEANPNLGVKEPIVEQTGNAANKIVKVKVTGVALAAGLTSEQIKPGDTVQVKIEQESQFKVADHKKGQMQLKLTLFVNGKKTQLASPIIMDIQLDKNMETKGLEIVHQHEDGKVDIITEGQELTTNTFVINRTTSVLTMKVASFSTFTFTTNKEKQVQPAPTAVPTAVPT